MKGKKILVILGILVVLGSVPVGVFLLRQRKEVRVEASPESVLFFDPVEMTVTVGEVVTVVAMVDANTNLVNGVEAYITYDPGALQFVEFGGGVMDLVQEDYPIYNNEEGYLYFAVWDLEGVEGVAKLGDLTFEIIGGAGEAVEVVYGTVSGDGIYVTKVADATELGVNVLGEKQGLIFQVENVLATATPTVTPTEEVSETPTATPTEEVSGTPTGTLTGTLTPTGMLTGTLTPTATGTAAATLTATPTATGTAAATLTATPTIPVTGLMEATWLAMAMAGLLLVLGWVFI